VKIYLLLLVPPLVGAVIGFITNVVAIRMLFRPLKEIRVFGIRLPFTPGILPRQRHKLALSIGSMVERELLTPEIVKQRIAREDVREKIRAALAQFTEKILAGPPAALFDNNENLIAEKAALAADRLYPQASSSVLAFLRRPDIHKELESKGRIFLRNVILKMNVFQRLFLSAGQYDLTLEQKMPEIIDELIASADNMLNDESTRKKLIGALTGAVHKAAGAESKNLAALFNISAEDKQKLDEYFFEKLMSAADKQIENVLVTINIKALVADRIDNLEMLRVERIILDVMADQLKWIDIFGAILGFLIGLFQSGFSLLLR
jgi:uncharacterized membrane protein YheB (UPF0754 family)